MATMTATPDVQEFINDPLIGGVAEAAAKKPAKKSKPAPAPAPVLTGDEDIDITNLVASTMFLKVRFGSLGNSKKVAGASSVLNTDCDPSLLRLSKTLLESKELEAVRKFDTSLRKWLSNTCLPYDIGLLLLPVGLMKQTRNKLKEHKEQRAVLVEEFIAAYPKLKEDAKAQLGSLFNEAEYPSPAEVRARFGFSYNIISFDVPGKLKSIDPDAYLEEVEKAEAQIQEAATEVTAVMRQACYELVNHLKDRLSPGPDGKPKILKESAINNLKEFLNNFDLRNVTNDKALALEVSKAKALLNGTDAVSLRTSDEFRSKILAGMENVSETLGKMVEMKPGRKFKEV